MDNSPLSEYYTPRLDLSFTSSHRLRIENDDNRIEDCHNDIILEQNEIEEEFKENYKTTSKKQRHSKVNGSYKITTIYEDKQEKPSVFCGFCRAVKDVDDTPQNRSGTCNIF